VNLLDDECAIELARGLAGITSLQVLYLGGMLGYHNSTLELPFLFIFSLHS
jgi:hypothetical protein